MIWADFELFRYSSKDSSALRYNSLEYLVLVEHCDSICGPTHVLIYIYMINISVMLSLGAHFILVAVIWMIKPYGCCTGCKARYFKKSLGIRLQTFDHWYHCDTCSLSKTPILS